MMLSRNSVLLMEVDLMQPPKSTTIMHKRPYDPVKAHEYYLRTRQLKGRRAGSSRFTVRGTSGQTVELSGRQLAEQRAYATKRVNEIKNRLSELTTKLHQLRADARKKEAGSKRETKKAPTAAEKSKAARESKQYREKHQQKLATKRKGGSGKGSTKSKSKADPIAELEDKITQVKGRLVAAVARQRALAAATRSS
jgi:uncharacterized phage infection (PIP) family protein YhgE